MIRRISTKLVLAVLAVVVLPFVAFALYINEQMAERLTRHVVQQALMGLAKDLANQLDYFVAERHQDLAQWGDQPLTLRAVEELRAERGAARVAAGDASVARWDAAALSRLGRETSTPANFDHERHFYRAQLTREFDRYLGLKYVYDVLLLVGVDGRLVTASTRYPGGGLLEEEYVARLFETDFSREGWFRECLDRRAIVTVDHHVSPYRLPESPDPSEPAWGYHLGFAAPVRAGPPADGEADPRRLAAVLYGLVNWSFVQDLAGTPVVRDAFRGLVAEEREPTPYAWIWASDADTILGHPNRDLYYQSITRDVRLPQLTQAVRDSADGWGLYPEYRFLGEAKNAAFKRCATVQKGGFGWVVGVGIDNDDIYATADELRTLLLGGTAVVGALVVGVMLLVARRTTGPILELQRYTRRVASGDLDAQVEIRTRDELGALAEDFNRMTRKLKEQQERIVKAEKDAAWREMARQIAHDIKNPLTPIRLSLDLLERARREKAEGLEGILDRTTALIQRQVSHLQEIASDFHEFTGGRKPKIASLDVGPLLDEVLHLHDAWAVELGVDVQYAGTGGRVLADESKLRRVLVNLVTNALQAMPEGGLLRVDAQSERGGLRIRIRDTGAGVPAEVREHLFEPYFTTRSEGTGLGLAISKQVIEQMAGTIELAPSEDGPGTVASVWLPG